MVGHRVPTPAFMRTPYPGSRWLHCTGMLYLLSAHVPLALPGTHDPWIAKLHV